MKFKICRPSIELTSGGTRDTAGRNQPSWIFGSFWFKPKWTIKWIKGYKYKKAPKHNQRLPYQ